MTSSTAPHPRAELGQAGPRGFTLIELILVMALLAIAASVSAPRMASFFRGRALDQEARRLLALTHYGASRAAAEGESVRLWIDPAAATYGLEREDGSRRVDERALVYVLDRDVVIESEVSHAVQPYEEVEAARPVTTTREGILFLPDGLIDPSSTQRITVSQGDEGAISLVLMPNGLAYELIHEDRIPTR